MINKKFDKQKIRMLLIKFYDFVYMVNNKLIIRINLMFRYLWKKKLKKMKIKH
jgi:hypothetical protein